MLRRATPSPLAACALLAAALPAARARGADVEPEDVEIREDEAPPKTPQDERMEAMEDRLQALETEVEELRAAARTPQSPLTLHGYADLGLFLALGNNGAGVVQDFGNRAFPEYSGRYGWVFLGDLLSTAVNARGEAADLGDLPGVVRFDSIDSRGAFGLVANELNLTVNVAMGERVRLTGSVGFVPRTGTNFAIGDFIDVNLAQVEWIVSEEVPTSIFVGKVEPVFGIEYKDRRAPDRLGVTPSLIARYTTGPQLAVKARSKLFDRWLILAASVANGSTVEEQFHFKDEIDSNFGKTLTGRGAVSIPLDRLANHLFSAPLELGFSGEWGAQDRARDSRDALVLFGPDLEYRGVNLQLRGQLMFGSAPGRAEDEVFGLDLRLGAYLEASYLFNAVFGATARFDLRDASVTLGDERLYLTKTWRVTVGARAVLSSFLIVKAEFIKNQEFGGVPDIDNDIFTSSLLAVF